MLSEVLSYQNDAIRATSSSVETIDKLPRQCLCACSVIISNNRLSSLKGIHQLKNISYLNIENNKISTINALEPLSRCHNLKNIVIRGNPICNFPLFYPYLLSIVPSLELINGKPISD